MHPRTLDTTWAAGVFEGEGYAGRAGTKFKTERVSVTQKDRWLVEKLRALFGGSICDASDGMHHWIVGGARARGFLMTIYVFLSPWRKAQVRKVLQPEQALQQLGQENERLREELKKAKGDGK